MWYLLQTLYFPTKANRYQARLAQPSIWLGLVLATALVNGIWFLSISRLPQIKGDTTDLSASQIITLTNQVRQAHHLSPLTENAKLTAAAFNKAQNMLETGNFNHSYQTEQGTINPWEFISATGYQYHYAGENLARNFISSKDLVDSWMGSPEHAANLLGANYQETGVAVVEGSFPNQPHTVLVVQLLASPQPTSVTNQAGPNLPANFQTTTLLSAPGPALWSPLNYPLALLLVTVSIAITIILVLLVDLTYGKRQRVQHLPHHLWRH